MTRSEVLKKAADQKTVRVLVKCQFVSSDGYPVNGNGKEFGRGWQQAWGWEKRSRPVQWLRANPHQWKAIKTAAENLRKKWEA